MAVYMCLLFLALGLLTLVWGSHSDAGRKAVHLGVGIAFVALAAIVMIGSAMRSLWLHPLS